ncbi:hypothetical protein BDV32DRAFT_121283 [Aspergillus pseudonomiae]|nr:hypothetical protein BDV32DRAFT_121283 [Aspergillus pseudonomiae]
MVNTTIRTQESTEIKPCGSIRFQKPRIQVGRQLPEAFPDIFVSCIRGGFQTNEVCRIILASTTELGHFALEVAGNIGKTVDLCGQGFEAIVGRTARPYERVRLDTLGLRIGFTGELHILQREHGGRGRGAFPEDRFGEITGRDEQVRGLVVCFRLFYLRFH